MSSRRTRREFLHSAARVGLGGAGMVLLGGCAVGPGRAPAACVATIGLLTWFSEAPAADGDSLLDNLRQGLRELGWLEGENMRFEIRRAPVNPVVPFELAAELFRIPVDLIVMQGAGGASVAAAAVTSTLPVVMVDGPADPVERGLVASIQRPGGNVTGLAQPPNEIYGKRLELLVEAVPHASRVAIFGVGPGLRALEETARTLGVQIPRLSVESEQHLEMAFGAVSRETADAVLVSGTPVTVRHQARIVDFAAQRQLPAMYEEREFAEAGGLMSYDANRAASYRRAAFYVDRILRGAKPGDLPIEYPTQYELVINLRTAGALGLTIPDSLLAHATEVIR